MQSERESAVKIHVRHPYLEIRRVLLWLLLGLCSFLLGFLSYVVAGIGFLLLTASLLLYSTAPFNPKDTDWVKEVHSHADILVAFGGPAVLGYALRTLLEVSFW